jgi:methylamine dehydrogenase accessory protein MauD
LVFVSPGCPACEGLFPGLRRFRADHQSEVEIILISSTESKEHNRVLSESGDLKRMPILVLPQLIPALNIGTTPYAIWVDQEGTVRAKGMTANLEHLESLWNARQLGVASINEYRRKTALSQSVGGQLYDKELA